MASAFGTGIISAWSVLWVQTILVVNDTQLDFQRIERLEGVHGSGRKVEQNGTLAEIKELGKKRPKVWRMASLEASTSLYQKRSSLVLGCVMVISHGNHTPSLFIERLDWVLDILCDFGGMRWNLRISGLPPPSKWVQEQLRENSGSDIPQRDTRAAHSEMAHVYQTRAELLRANLKTFMLGYLSSTS